MEIEKRFLRNVKITDNGCWIWQGYKNKKGYGSFFSEVGTLAHRFSYHFYNGKLKANKQVCHTCDNPACVNPKHLWLGTNKQNQHDSINKGRSRKAVQIGSSNGQAKLTEEDVKKIREMAKTMFQKDIAKAFNCNQSTVHAVLTGKTWSHV